MLKLSLVGSTFLECVVVSLDHLKRIVFKNSIFIVPKRRVATGFMIITLFRSITMFF